MKRGSSQRCDGGLTVRGADGIPGDTAPTGDDRRRVRRGPGRARAGPDRNISPRCQDRLATSGRGISGTGVSSGQPGMEYRPDEVADVLLAIAPVAGLDRVVAAAPGLGTALGYDIEAALEEPGDL